MVRSTGSVRDENSLIAPTDELFSSVVRRSSGKRAKRMSGTESRPPTKTEPTPINAARKERLFSSDDPGAAGPSVIASESPARAHIECSPDYELQHNPRPGGLRLQPRRSAQFPATVSAAPGCTPLGI